MLVCWVATKVAGEVSASFPSSLLKFFVIFDVDALTGSVVAKY
jgi:hypothetical protein